MDALGHVLCLFLLLGAGVLTFADNPGGKIIVTSNGINYANTVAEEAIRQKLQTITIPDQSGDENRFSWGVSNIQNRGITGPNTNIAFSPENGGLTLSVSNFGASLHADWNARYRILFTIRAHGSVDADVSGVSLSVTVALGEKNGRPSVSARSCSCSIGDLGLRISGGLISFILNWFKGGLQNKLKDLLQSKVCDLVTEVINGAADEELSKIKVSTDIARLFVLDYSLVAPPVVTSSYLEIKNKGEVYWKSNRQVSPYAPREIPAPSDLNTMLQVWLTDYAANTFLYAAHINGYLNYNLDVGNIPDVSSILQNIGSQLGTTIPATDIQLQINSSTAPTVTFDTGNLTVAVVANVELVAQIPNEDPSVLALTMSLSLTVQAGITNEKLVATISGYSFDVNISRSDFGDINQQELKEMLREAIDQMIIPGVNSYGEQGIDLPVTGAVRFYNTNFNVLSGSLLVSTDVQKL